MDKINDMGHLMELPLKNGPHSCPVDPPKFKRQNVSAIHDFPPDCWRKFQLVSSVANGENHEVMDDICAFLKVSDASNIFGNVVESQNQEMIYDTLVVATAKGLDTEGDSQSTNEMICDALGTNAAIELGNNDKIHSPFKEIGHASNKDTPEALKNEVDHQSMQELCNVLEVNSTKTTGSVFDPKSSDEGLKNLIPVRELKSIGSVEEEIMAGMVGANDVEESSTVKCLKKGVGVISDNDGFLNPSKSVHASISGIDGKEYPPCRRISAVRDFPPLCGISLHHPNVKCHQEAFASSEMKINQEARGENTPKPQQLVQKSFKVNRIGITDATILGSPSDQKKETAKFNLLSSVNKKEEKMCNLTWKRRQKIISKMPMNDNNFEVSKGKSIMKPTLISKRQDIVVDLPPFGIGVEKDSNIRSKVRKSLRMFQAVVRKLVQQNEANGGKNSMCRVDLLASGILKEQEKFVNPGKQIIGAVPGVEIGDEFHYRVELNIIGLHRRIQHDIDYIKQGSLLLATSIVVSGGYTNHERDESDVLIYSGSGGNMTMQGGKKEHEDQKLDCGNLALMTSISEKNPVRVIRGCKGMKTADSCDHGSGSKIMMTYSYDGLYLVTKFWKEVGVQGKRIFKFELIRIPGQSEPAWKEVRRAREGVFLDDISQGEESIPIRAVNLVDNEKIPPFKYITKMVYPSGSHLWTPDDGCKCIDGCFDLRKCSCILRNGGEIPYNLNGDIVEAKGVVYECGASCLCARSCRNTVSQHGLKFELEVFKTEWKGWGVRSMNSISSGSYVCEYLGELLNEEKPDSDEYLFEIADSFDDDSEEICSMGYTIDAARFGNVGRFINHSCRPNLYAQSICYGDEDKKTPPHIVFFAAENIPPLQELTYHYNYEVDEVRDANGNVKEKECRCGSPECSRRIY